MLCPSQHTPALYSIASPCRPYLLARILPDLLHYRIHVSNKRSVAALHSRCSLRQHQMAVHRMRLQGIHEKVK